MISKWNTKPAKQVATATSPKPLEPILPLKTQVFELLRQNGFGFDESRELAAEVMNQFYATRQRVFAFGPVSFEITAGLRTRLISTLIGH
jgi:hypothetical protein